ncbi:MAG: MATE family efflux transporter [Pseudobutyrivibrio sp.]|nr:MATE family efflux transporter [Pseudobutyrivibrio sp.]
MNSKSVDLLNGSICKCIMQFSFPLFLGQLLQQLYNLADSWVLGNFAEQEAFAAVASGGSLSFFVVGFVGGLGAGGGIIISRYFGADDRDNVEKAIHANVMFAIIASAFATFVGVTFIPKMLVLMDTPVEVLPYGITYFRIYFGGITTMVMYNGCMNIMRALGDSFHPLIYLIISSVINVVLDLVLVAGLHTGVVGAAVATIVSQGISAVLCINRLMRAKDYTRLQWSKLKWYPQMMKQVVVQGLPMGIQNSVISIGNIVVQRNINLFGSYAMSGMGAYSRIEGFVFLPINCMSMSLPTFISQNLGAKKYDRAKKGAAFGILSGMIFAEIIGVIFRLYAAPLLRIFVDSDKAIEYGVIHSGISSLFFFLLAFSHCAAGVMRGCGKSIVPMVTMLSFWCALRVTYVTIAIQLRPQFSTISWCYPLTWSCSTIVFLVWLLTKDWVHSFERKI